MSVEDAQSVKLEITVTRQARYIVITPVRDEVDYVAHTITSVTAQTIRPLRWIIVDDGSTDGTGKILDEAAATHDWITVVHRANRGHRAAGGGVVEAFNAGYALVTDDEWDYIVKLDGDLSFQPDYFELCFAEFQLDPRLGIAGGTVCQLESGRLKVDSVGDPTFHVRGATKIYGHACWGKISPLMPAPGWDTIDEVSANHHGWTTRTLHDIPLVQHKPTGQADGSWRNHFKNGKANYISGYHPLFMLAKCAKRTFRDPILLESVALLAGYFSAFFSQSPRVPDPAVVQYLRRQQLRRMFFLNSIYK